MTYADLIRVEQNLLVNEEVIDRCDDQILKLEAQLHQLRKARAEHVSAYDRNFAERAQIKEAIDAEILGS